jgi:hypothetical protein
MELIEGFVFKNSIIVLGRYMRYRLKESLSKKASLVKE